jgi:hypothetical protein
MEILSSRSIRLLMRKRITFIQSTWLSPSSMNVLRHPSMQVREIDAL